MTYVCLCPVTAKVAAQVADYHRAARRCLENALKTGEYLSENIGDRKMKVSLGRAYTGKGEALV